MAQKAKIQLAEGNQSKLSGNSNKIFSVKYVMPPSKQADTQISDSSMKSSQIVTNQIQSLAKEDSVYSEFNLNKENNILFSVNENEEICFKKEIVLSACPIIAHHKELDLKHKRISVVLPKWVTVPMVKEFFIYFEDEDYTNFTISARQLLLISDYFDNQLLVTKIIKNEIIPYINTLNCLLYMEDSFLKLNSKTKNKIWFDLFYECLNFCSKNLVALMNGKDQKLKKINKKILEEIIEK
jgi:hypothetical protein